MTDKIVTNFLRRAFNNFYVTNTKYAPYSWTLAFSLVFFFLFRIQKKTSFISYRSFFSCASARTSDFGNTNLEIDEWWNQWNWKWFESVWQKPNYCTIFFLHNFSQEFAPLRFIYYVGFAISRYLTILVFFRFHTVFGLLASIAWNLYLLFYLTRYFGNLRSSIFVLYFLVFIFYKF